MQIRIEARAKNKNCRTRATFATDSFRSVSARTQFSVFRWHAALTDIKLSFAEEKHGRPSMHRGFAGVITSGNYVETWAVGNTPLSIDQLRFRHDSPTFKISQGRKFDIREWLTFGICNLGIHKERTHLRSSHSLRSALSRDTHNQCWRERRVDAVMHGSVTERLEPNRLAKLNELSSLVVRVNEFICILSTEPSTVIWMGDDTPPISYVWVRKCIKIEWVGCIEMMMKIIWLQAHGTSTASPSHFY